jgi:hypothetical protein
MPKATQPVPIKICTQDLTSQFPVFLLGAISNSGEDCSLLKGGDPHPHDDAF